MRDQLNAELLTRAHSGDSAAWREIVRRYSRLVWAVPRSHRLSRHDAADVCQNTWLALAEHLDRIRHPERLGAWLVTTARNEAVTVLRLRGRELPLDLWGGPADDTPTPEESALTGDVETRLWRAYTGLTDRCREILRLVAFAPELSFTQVAEAVGIPVNSLGATRGRCLTTLRRRAALEPVR